MSRKWTSYVAPKPPKENAKRLFFLVKSHFAWRKTATKFLCVKTISNRVVRHSFTYLSMYKWLVGDVPFYAKIRQILTHPIAKRWFSICFHSCASAVTINTNMQSTMHFPTSLRWTSYVAPKPQCKVSTIWTVSIDNSKTVRDRMSVSINH